MNNFFKSIKFKIVLTFGLCIALLIANGGFGVVGLTRLSADMNELYTGNTRPIAQLGTVRFARTSISLMAVRAQHSQDPAERQKLIEMIRAEQEELNTFWNAYYPQGIISPEERAVADQIMPLLKDFNEQIATITSALAAGDSERLDKAVIKLLADGDEMGVLLRKDTQINLDLARNFAEGGKATASFLIWTAISLTVIGLLIGLSAIVYLVRAITRPLSRALNVANNIAEGKLENQVAIDTQDEFGQLLDSLQRMDAQLTRIVREIKVSTESVTVASREIASGNLDLSARTEEQAASLEETAASLEETAASMTQLTETVKQNADNARQANTMASDATGMAEAGDSSVQAMISTVGKLSDSSAKISDITGLIEGIAFQTNILALNAAVEAARAGEQGRGFAVVASEVRTLAQRSSAAAKEIKVLIDASVTMARDGSKQAEDVGVTMGKVKLGIKHVSDIVNEIAKASEEQSQGIEQVHQAIAQMDDVTQQNAALVEEAAAAAQSLEEQANTLKDAVSVFQVQQGVEFLAHTPVVNAMAKRLTA